MIIYLVAILGMFAGFSQKNQIERIWDMIHENPNGDVLSELGGENILRLKYSKGCVGTSKKSGCALQFSISLDYDAADEMWLSYDVFFEEGFDFRNGGKLPGICGGKCYTGGEKTASDGWSDRIMWKKDGYLTQYVYHVGQKGKYADNYSWNLNGLIEQRKIQTGVWHTITTRVKMNTVTKDSIFHDGIIQGWLDGERVLDVDTLYFRDNPSVKADRFYFSTFHGGNNESYAPRWDSYIRFRRIKLGQSVDRDWLK